MKIRLGQIELARGLAHRESPTRLSLATAREAQVVRVVRAVTAAIFDRGNARTVVTFTVVRRHENVERALRFAAVHPLALANEVGSLTLVSEDGTAAAETSLGDATLRSLHCQPAGIITSTDYEFVGSQLTCRTTGTV